MKKQLMLPTLLLTVLALAACTPSAGGCPTSTAELNQLVNAEDGYCLLYPAEFSTNTPPFILILNPASPAAGDVLGDAWASIEMENADGHTVAQIADAQIAAYDLEGDFNIKRQLRQVDGEQAVIVDGLPGQDPWRKVFIVHGERLYTLTFLPWVPDAYSTGQPTPLEDLFETVMPTLHFTSPTKPLPTPTQPWGVENLPPGLTFEFPLDGQMIDYESTYSFKVTDIGADGYFWTFSQSGEVVWDSLRDDKGGTAGGGYFIAEGSEAHSRFVPGPVEVSVRAMKGDYLAEPTVITIILE